MHSPSPDSIFEFHAQQAIEKLLKALIAAHGERFPFTHNLQLLIDQLIALDEQIPAFSRPLFTFTKFGIAIRYDTGVPLTAAERSEFRTIIKHLRQFVTARVASLPTPIAS